jgi:hypothetical protein
MRLACSTTNLLALWSLVTGSSVSAPQTITLRNSGSTLRWLQLSEVEVFASGVEPSSSTSISNNRITSGLSFSHYTGGFQSGFEPGTVLTDGVQNGQGFALNSWTGPENSVTLSLEGVAAVGVVRVWQRTGCCFTRLSDIEVVLNVSGTVSVLSYSGQPALFAQVNFGPEMFAWATGAWSPTVCPSACGSAASLRMRAVSCVGDRGSLGAAGTAGCDVATMPSANGSCPHTGCCGMAHNTLYVSNGGDDSALGCDASAPMGTLASCVAAAGDHGTCLLSPGSYHESVYARGVTNLTITRADPSAGRVLIDGTVPIVGGWEARTDASGAAFFRSVQPVTSPRVWQLFLDGVALTSARWPDALSWTPDAWDRSRGWASQAAGSTLFDTQRVSCAACTALRRFACSTRARTAVCGHSIDAGSATQRLADLNVSVNGCNAIINNEHWVTRRCAALALSALRVC